MEDHVDRAVRWLVAGLRSGTSADDVSAHVTERVAAGGRLALAVNKDPRFAAWRAGPAAVQEIDRAGPFAARVLVRVGAESWELQIAVETTPPHLIRSFVPRLVPPDGIPWNEVAAEAVPTQVGSTLGATASAEVHDRLIRLRKERHLVSLVVAVVVGGTVVHQELLGVDDLTAKQPVAPGSRFAVGSCTKLPTALTVLALAADGRLDLEASIDRYLDVPVLVSSSGSTPTLTDLLLHRAGIPRDVDRSTTQQLIDGEKLDAVVPVIELTDRSGGPAYSNLGYELLGAVVEAVTKEDHADVVEREIRTRFGMTGSTLQRAGAVAPLDVTGYRSVGGFLTATRAKRPWSAAGGMSSTLADMTSLAAALAVASDPIVRTSYEITARAGEGARFAPGYALYDRDDGVVAWRAGSVDGFTADLQARRDGGRAVVFLTNTSPADRFLDVGAELLTLAA